MKSLKKKKHRKPFQNKSPVWPLLKINEADFNDLEYLLKCNQIDMHFCMDRTERILSRLTELKQVVKKYESAWQAQSQK
jgi:hypothetical protein